MKKQTNKTVPKQIMAFGITAAISLAAFSGQSAVWLEDTFNNRQPGEALAGSTSDGKGTWFGAAGNHGGTTENPNYHPLFNGLGYGALGYDHNGDANGVDSLPVYVAKFGTVTLGGLTDGTASSVMICARKTDTALGYGYDFRPSGDFPFTHWNVYYQPAEGATRVLVGKIDGENPTIENLELRVYGNSMRLYTNGVPFDVAGRPTMGQAGSGIFQRALEIIVNTTADRAVEAKFDDLSLSTPEPQSPFQDSVAGTLLAYDGFDYPEGFYLHDVTPGGFGWAGGYTKGEQYGHNAAFIANPVYGTQNAPLVVAPGSLDSPLYTSGNRVSTADYRTMRYLDVDSFPAELKEGDGTVLRKTGKSIWVSAILQQASAADGFFGLSLFSNSMEVVFLGKAGGAAAVVWRVEGKFPNTTGLTTHSPMVESLLLFKIEWNWDGTPDQHDKIYLWVNPNVDHPSATLDPATADAVSIRNSTNNPTATNPNRPQLAFNRVGVRGQNTSDGRIDEVRIGTTFRSVLPSDRSELDVHVSKVNEDMVLRWKTKPGFVLKSTDSLPASSWTTVDGTPQPDGLDSVLTIVPSGEPKFYRLAGE